MVSPAAGSLPKGNTASTEEAPIHVLYVDDEAGLLKAAKPILEMQGSFHVETASSVEEAMKKMEEETFDVIVSDYIMSGKDGLEFLKELRDSGNSIPFIIFTGKGREIVAIKALNLGADQYINKIGKTEAVYNELAHGIRTVVKGKKAEEALKDSEKEKSAVLDSMSELVSHQDLNHRILWVNKKAADSVNIKAEQLKGRYCHELWAKSAKPCAACPVEDTIKTGQPQQGEITTPDGRVWSISGYPIKDVNGNTTSIVEVTTEITEQKKAEEKLRESEAKYRALVENIGNGIATIDLEGRFVFVNQALCKIFGYSEKELIGKPFADFLHPDDKKRLLQIFLDSWKNPNRKFSIEFRAIHKKGHIVHIYSSPTTTMYKNEIVGFNAILSDITKHKLAEKALGESEEKYRNVLEHAPDLIVTMDAKGVVTSCNAALERGTDYYQQEIIGKHFLETPLLCGLDSAYAQRLFNAIIEGKHPERIELTWFLKDGTPRISEVRIGLTKRDGKIAGFTAVARDITERKEAEKKLDKIMNGLVAINEKLGVVGRLTRHDARNKLSVIANNVYLAKQKLAADNGALEFLGDVESAIDQMEKIFDFARNYEMLGVEELVYMDVGKSVEEAAMLLSGMNELKLVNECKGLMVMADSLLRQLFYNLIDNTLKYGEKVSQIRVYHEEGEDQLKLVYEDDGVGIPENEKEKLFKEGYGKSTGYGLYLIKKICEEYGWTSRETGKQGKGVQFIMTIPKTTKNGKKSYRIN